MAKNNEDNAVFSRIEELKKRVPGWANKLSAKKGKKPGTIRAWSTGDRGMTKGHHLWVLETLIELDNERTERIQKLTA